jgi:hypothetical protein
MDDHKPSGANHMGISLVRLVLLCLGLMVVALALSFNLAAVINSFYDYAHNLLSYPGFAGFPH